MIAAGTAPGLTEGQIIGDFYAKYFSLVNVLGLLLQLFVVSRIVKHRGVAWAVMVLPALSFGAYNILVFVPAAQCGAGGQGRRELDRLLAEQHRAEHAVPAVHLRAEVRRQAGDRLVLRPDGRRALGGARLRRDDRLALPPRGFAAVNAALAVVALILAWRVGRHYKIATDASSPPAAAA